MADGVRLGIGRRRDIDPDGSTNRTAGKITARYPGHMVHLDVKKVGRIPDGGGWRAHGRGSAADKAAQRAKAKGARAGDVYLHSAVDGFSRLAYTEHLPNETAATTIGFFCRARAFFAAHGIGRLVRVVTDNGPNDTAKAFIRTVTAVASRHQRIRPYTGVTNVMSQNTFKGLTDEVLRWQTERFRELQEDDDGWVVTLRPEQVVEIAFDGVQRSSRYSGGAALRFARVLRYREDRTPDEADTIETVRSLLRSDDGPGS